MCKERKRTLRIQLTYGSAEPDKNENSIVSFFTLGSRAICYISLFYSLPEENANKKDAALPMNNEKDKERPRI